MKEWKRSITQLSPTTRRVILIQTSKFTIRKEFVGLYGFLEYWWSLQRNIEFWAYQGSEHESGHEITGQTVICVEPDYRKRSRTHDEETKQKTCLLRSNKASTGAPFIGGWNWKHLLLFWGKSIAISCFGYAWVIFHFYLCLSIASARICLPIWNVGNWRARQVMNTAVTC